MIEKAILVGYLMSNWEEFTGYLEDYLPIVGEVVSSEINYELDDAISNEELVYEDLVSAIQSKLDVFVKLEWTSGEPDDQEVITEKPDKIYLLYPDTELVICELTDVYAFYNSIDWSCIGAVIFKIFGAVWNVSFLQIFFAIWGDDDVPWTKKLIFRDSSTGVVQAGDQFDPVKSIKWGDVESYIIKGIALAVIFKVMKDAHLINKSWTALKMGNDWRVKRIMRQTLNILQSSISDVDTKIDQLDALIDTVNSKIDTVDTLLDSLTVQSAKLDTILNRIGIRFRLQ